MRESKKSQLGSLIAILGIAFIAFFLIFALNSLAWPVGTTVGNVISELPNPVRVPNGVLRVSVYSNQTIVGIESTRQSTGITIRNPDREALPGILVSVFLNSITSPTITNFTDSSGQIQESLAPNSYTIKFFDWRLDNLTVSVQVNSNSITDLNVTVNASSYAVQSFNIADPDSSGFAVGWGQVYALVATNRSLTFQNQITFLDTVDSPATPIANIDQLGLTPITFTTTSSTNDSQWVQIQVKTPMNISSVRSMSILALHSVYSVKTNVLH
jgi:hypothetical protein